MILSARYAIEERVNGLDMGANDYMTKPFDFLELEARIRTLSRISYIQQGNVLTCGSLRLNMATKNVTYHENNISLTKKEFAILEYLMLQKGQVISAKRLMNHTCDSHTDLFPDTLKYYIHSIKKKLVAAHCQKELIRNVRGKGYKIEEETE